MDRHVVRFLTNGGELGDPKAPIDVSPRQRETVAEGTQVDSENRVGEEEGDDRG